jgi:hypothetical protein
MKYPVLMVQLLGIAAIFLLAALHVQSSAADGLCDWIVSLLNPPGTFEWTQEEVGAENVTTTPKPSIECDLCPPGSFADTGCPTLSPASHDHQGVTA